MLKFKSVLEFILALLIIDILIIIWACGVEGMVSMPKYNPLRWNSLSNKKKLNCYDYAFNNASPHNRAKSQPGQYSGGFKNKKVKHTCDSVSKLIKEDHLDDISRVAFEDECGADEYKIALLMSHKDGKRVNDYHFMRQDESGLWSQKLGDGAVTNKDRSGNVITAPHLANNKSRRHNYNELCGYYCVKNTAGKKMNGVGIPALHNGKK